MNAGLRMACGLGVAAALAACNPRLDEPERELSMCDTCIACVSNLTTSGDTIRLTVCSAWRVSMALGASCVSTDPPDTVVECARIDPEPPQTWQAVLPRGADDAWVWVWRNGGVRTWVCVTRDSTGEFTVSGP